MQKIFDQLIERFLLDNVGIVDNFLSAQLSNRLKENLLSLIANKELTSAGIGHQKENKQNKLIRNDNIYWLDRSHHNVSEDAFLDIIDLFVQHLNKTCFTGITSHEFHYSCYEKGSFYLKHLDQFRSNNSRKYSMIMYLNTSWQRKDGGELCIHHPIAQIQLIDPTSGKAVFFKSDQLIHEVLLTQVQRLSITGWLKVDSN